jgi:hypothetical protein
MTKSTINEGHPDPAFQAAAASIIDISTIIFYYPQRPITNLKHARSISHGRK